MTSKFRPAAAALMLALSLCALSACSSGPQVSGERDPQASGERDPQASESSSRYVASMDTVITLTAYGSAREEALDLAEKEILRLNDLLSIGEEGSEVSVINRDGGGTLSDDVRALVEESLALYESTDGAFDITVYPLMELWGFTSGNYRVPSDSEIAKVLETVDAGRLRYDPDTHFLTLGEGQTIDLGGIAKGYASARIMDIFREAGVTSGLVSLGGNVQCLDAKPDGSAYRLGIRDPKGSSEEELALVITARNKAVITSGGYERFFVDDETGATYQHIMDPKTGRPAETDLASVTIVTESGILGDGLSTALYIMGLDGAADYWRAHSGEFEAVLITGDGRILVTEGLKDEVVSDTKYEVIKG